MLPILEIVEGELGISLLPITIRREVERNVLCEHRCGKEQRNAERK